MLSSTGDPKERTAVNPCVKGFLTKPLEIETVKKIFYATEDFIRSGSFSFNK